MPPPWPPVEAVSAIVGRTPLVMTHMLPLPPQSETTLEYKFMRFKDNITTPDAELSQSVLGNGFNTLKEAVEEATSKDKNSRKKVFSFEAQKI
jgi:hypothetical protein